MIKSTHNKVSVPAGACYHFWKCGNVTPGGKESNNEMCDECLDDVRDQGHGIEIERLN